MRQATTSVNGSEQIAADDVDSDPAMEESEWYKVYSEEDFNVEEAVLRMYDEDTLAVVRRVDNSDWTVKQIGQLQIHDVERSESLNEWLDAEPTHATKWFDTELSRDASSTLGKLTAREDVSRIMMYTLNDGDAYVHFSLC